MTYSKLLWIVVPFIALIVIGYSISQHKQPISTVNASEQHINQHEYSAYHYPVQDEKIIDPVAYLSLPFKRSDLLLNRFSVNEAYRITEGWLYSAEELKITGVEPERHHGIDYAVAYDTPVVAPADGYALSTYQTAPLIQEAGTIRTYQDKQVNLGYGYFVRMYIPSTNRFITLAHLSDVDAAIPFYAPEYTGDSYIPPGYLNVSLEDWKAQAVEIKKGTVIGKVGYSGLNWGYDEYEYGAERPTVIDPNEYVSWDEPHLHLAEHWLDFTTGEVILERDPYAIYNTQENYPNDENTLSVGQSSLFFLNDKSKPLFVAE